MCERSRVNRLQSIPGVHRGCCFVEWADLKWSPFRERRHPSYVCTNVYTHPLLLSTEKDGTREGERDGGGGRRAWIQEDSTTRTSTYVETLPTPGNFAINELHYNREYETTSG